MNKLLSTVVASAMVFLAAQAHADRLRLGDPAYGGTGCPAGSASTTVSPDQQSLSILFDSYVTEAGNTTGKQVDRKSCNITVPVHVPQGYSVAVFQVDYRGFNALPSGARSRFNAEYFWAGSQGPTISRNFLGPINNDFTLTNNLIASTLVWTPCGASVNLRVNTSLMTSTNSAFQQALSTVDSADISAGLVYHIQWRRCN
jgi:hypothetical protein